jgi:fatty acid desaturase
LLRFGLLTPLGLISPRLRAVIEARFSALTINPAYRRPRPSPALRRRWVVQETLAAGWALSIAALLASGMLGWRSFALAIAVMAAVAVVNQFRTLAAHLWLNSSGEMMSLTAQFADSVNVPPPGLLPALWAPVGLRYHALHHLLPSLAYHDLGKAHRMLSLHFAAGQTYHRSSYRRLFQVVRIWAKHGH